MNRNKKIRLAELLLVESRKRSGIRRRNYLALSRKILEEIEQDNQQKKVDAAKELISKFIEFFDKKVIKAVLNFLKGKSMGDLEKIPNKQKFHQQTLSESAKLFEFKLFNDIADVKDKVTEFIKETTQLIITVAPMGLAGTFVYMTKLVSAGGVLGAMAGFVLLALGMGFSIFLLFKQIGKNSKIIDIDSEEELVELIKNS